VKILLLQPAIVRNYGSIFKLKTNNTFKNFFKKINFKKFYHYFKIRSQINISSELNHYGDFVNIIGSQNVTAIERFHPNYLNINETKYDQYIKKENYPSNFGYEAPQFIREKDIKKNLKDFDVIFASIYFGKNLESICWNAKRLNKIVVLFDNIDHEEVYFNYKEIYRGYNYEMFDIYFKKDIPLSFEDKKIYPIAPVPCKLNFFDKKKIDEYKFENLISDIFFVGSFRKNITRYERLEICNFFKEMNLKNKILVNKENINFEDYLKFAINTNINLSPGGRVWCSYRHTDLANFRKPIILPKPNCKTAPGKFIDGENSIMYDTISRDKNVFLKSNPRLKEKVDFYLKNDNERNLIGKNYFELIAKYHTTHKRAKYLLEVIKSLL
jgi:hypothetical protein